MNGSRTMIMRGSEQPHFAADSHFAAEFIIFYRTVFISQMSISLSAIYVCLTS
jgi:hypothetical protein